MRQITVRKRTHLEEQPQIANGISMISMVPPSWFETASCVGKPWKSRYFRKKLFHHHRFFHYDWKLNSFCHSFLCGDINTHLSRTLLRFTPCFPALLCRSHFAHTSLIERWNWPDSSDQDGQIAWVADSGVSPGEGSRRNGGPGKTDCGRFISKIDSSISIQCSVLGRTGDEWVSRPWLSGIWRLGLRRDCTAAVGVRWVFRGCAVG